MSNKNYSEICKKAYLDAKIAHNYKNLEMLIKQYENPPQYTYFQKLQNKYYVFLENMILEKQIQVNKKTIDHFRDLKYSIDQLFKANNKVDLSKEITTLFEENKLWEDPSWSSIKEKLQDKMDNKALKAIDGLVANNSQDVLKNLKQKSRAETPIKDGFKSAWLPTGAGGGLVMLSQVLKDIAHPATLLVGGGLILGVLGKEGLKKTSEAVKTMIFSKDAWDYLDRKANAFLDINARYIQARLKVSDKSIHRQVSASTMGDFLKGQSFLNKIHSYLLKDKTYICAFPNYINQVPKILEQQEHLLKNNLINSVTNLGISGKVQRIKV